ncbi:transposase [Limnospira indica PCC 8005]|nr:transposase [Limnospira indica PCC 8005]CDM97244.1 transposase [Limnospira indica PCC 8005]
MSRPLARATKGKKVYELRKSYRGQKMTIIGAIKLSGVVATQTL